MMNIPMLKPSCPGLQLLTFSSYCGGNVCKGGVSLQLCGYITTESLWVGRTPDGHYQTKCGILQKQKDFVSQDDSSNIPFTMVIDKGYQIAEAAWRQGKQMVLQPTFARSDQKFSSMDVLSSSAIASNRGGNERAVRVVKMSALLKRGFQNNSSTDHLANVWLVWGFQVNFMFCPTL